MKNKHYKSLMCEIQLIILCKLMKMHVFIINKPIDYNVDHF